MSSNTTLSRTAIVWHWICLAVGLFLIWGCGQLNASMGSPMGSRNITYEQNKEGVKIQGLAFFVDALLLASDAWKSITGKSIEDRSLIDSINKYENTVREIAAITGVPYTTKMGSYYLPGTPLFVLGLAFLLYSLTALTSRWLSWSLRIFGRSTASLSASASREHWSGWVLPRFCGHFH